MGGISEGRLIDYERIGRAIDFYQGRGYKLIDAPWTASKEAVLATAPEGTELYPLGNEDEYLVASAEQSFIYLMDDWATDVWSPQSDAKRVVAVTPCFRDDKIDRWHKRYFLKIELMWYGYEMEYEHVVQCLVDANDFFNEELQCSLTLEVEKSEHKGELDLLLKGIEVGSYGLREYNGHRWVYGTGLAEPRFSDVLDYHFGR